MRTAEVVFVGDAASLIRASRQAAAATEAATAKIAGANEKMATSAASAAATVTKVGRDVALGFAGAAAESVHLAMKMEGVTASIAAAGGSSVAAADKIKAAFLSTAGTALFSAEKQGEAFAKVAGELKAVEGHTLTAAQATKVMSAAMALTEATGGDLTSTTEALGQVMKTYGLHSSQAAEASDVLFNASKQTGTSVETLAQTVDRIRGRLGALSPTLKESAGLMVDLSKHGVTGRLVMGALGGTFNTLLGQGKGVTAMAKQLNLQIFDSHGKFVGIKSVIAQLNPELSKYTQASQLAATKVLFGASANKVMLDLIHQGPQAYQAATTAVSKHGAAEEAAKLHADTFGGQVKKLRAALEDYATIVGEKLIPVLKFMVTGLQDGVKWMKNHEAAAIALTGVIGTALGGALLVFASSKAKKFIGATKDMIGASKALAVRMGITAAAVTAADGEMVVTTEAASVSMKAALITTGIGAALVALGVAAVALEGKWEPIMKTMAKVTEEAAEEMVKALNKVKEAAEIAAEGPLALRRLIPGLGGNVVPNIPGVARGKAPEFTEAFLRSHPNREPIEGTNNQKTLDTGGGIMGYFMSKGLTAAQAAGIVGNFQQESSLNPNMNTREGRGLDSGTGSRAHGGTPKQQLEAYWKELTQTSEYGLAALRKAKTPQEAARIFSERFERPSKPMLSNRERYAAEAYAKHPQSHHTAAQHAAEGYGTKSLPESTKAAKHKKAHGESGPSSAAIDRWAEQSVGKFAESWGPNQGPELNQLQKQFHTTAAAWCFGAGTLITTPLGLRPIEDLLEGDVVFSGSGNKRQITAINDRPSEVLNLVAYGIDGTTVTAEHPYWARRLIHTRRGRAQRRVVGEAEWIPAGELKRGDFIAIPRPLVDTLVPMDDPLAYVIGRYLADGWTSNDRVMVCGAHQEEAEIRGHLDAANLQYSVREYPTVTQFTLGAHMRAILADCGTGAHEKRVPTEALRWPATAREALVRGYFDGDGSTTRSEGPRASSVSRPLIYGIAELLRSLGRPVKIRVHRRSGESLIEGRTVKCSPVVYEVCEARQREDRRSQYMVDGDVTWVPVRSVQLAGKATVYNLTVAVDETFVADGAVVHNCAEFATTAAMMGGANKAVRTASVATIREWAEHGSHGYKKGVSHTPHVGDMMMFGNSHVGFVQSVHGNKVTTIEGNTSAGKVATRTHSVSEGDYASPIYHNLKTGKVLLERESKAYAEAVKKAEHLLLTSGQEGAVRRNKFSAHADHATVSYYSERAEEAGSSLEARQARWNAVKQPLSSAAGAHNAMAAAGEVVSTDKAEKRYYERELKALQKEAKAFGRLRDQYLSFARHVHGGAKKEALNKAAGYQKKIETAQKDAKALKGTIYSTETKLIEAESVAGAVPAEIAAANAEAAKDAEAKAAEGLSNDLSAYQAANNKINMEERAKIITPDQAKAAREANARKAEAGGFGALSDEGLLQVKGDLVEFEKAVTDSTTALEAHTQAALDSAKAMTEHAQAAQKIAEVEAGVGLKAAADQISGQIAGVNYHGRAMTPGAGTAARY